MEKQLTALVVLKSLQKDAQKPIKAITDLEISTNEDFTLAGMHLKQVKQIAKLAKDKEEVFTIPLKKLLADVTNLFKPFRDEVKQIEESTKAKMLEFTNQQEQAKKQLEQDFSDGKIKKVDTLLKKSAALEVSSAFSQTRKIWTAIEVDGTKTPREYMEPNLAAIKEALKAGKKVNGWKWEQVNSIAV